MAHYKGRAGNIYVEKARDTNENSYEVWFEDFCIIGTGDSEIAALRDAVRHVADIGDLVRSAIAATGAQAASGG